jgi:hypothetical protein
MTMSCKFVRALTFALVVSVLCLTAASAQTFNVQPFATGTVLSATSPDSVDVGLGSVWISYQNGADTTGLFGSSTVVRYSLSGAVQNTWTIAGNVDGLRIDPSGKAWALQNNDGNTYTNVPNRGFDDAQFLKGTTYLSETNPASNSDPIVLKLTTGLSSPLQVSGILNSQFTGTNLATGLVTTDTITDSDSLIKTPNGDLALTGEGDQQIVFIHNPGHPNQSESFINLLGTNGQTINGFPDDTAFVTSKSGYFIMTDTGANTVYKIYANGLTVGSVFVDVGDEFGSLDLTTGIVTPIFTGISPHGLEFVPTPEPGTLMMFASGLVGLGGILRRKLNR